MSKEVANQSRQFVQPGLGTTITKEGGELKSLWIELPAWCDLFCPYCFASARRVDYDKNNLLPAEYYSILKNFAEMGGKDVGIPGSGEPFHSDSQIGGNNKALTLEILKFCKELDLSLTIFTTGHFIDIELAQKLLEYNVILLVKYNSMIPEIQNELVGSPKHLNYALERDHALLTLMSLGFNKPAFGKNSRLGIVTSVMNANKDELPSLMRFARRHNLIFDCDTILERGRGKSFDERGGSPPDEEMQSIFRNLQKIDAEEFDNHWDISRSYIGTSCDRFRHHLYVSKSGQVHPCVGAVTVDLGNIRDKSLSDCWNSPAMKVIRNHQYSGKCTECANFQEQKCYSCLGRCTECLNNDYIERNSHVLTTGCWNYRSI